jgi:hypothetical protein
MCERFDGQGGGSIYASGTGRTIEFPNAMTERMASRQRYCELNKGTLREGMPCRVGRSSQTARSWCALRRASPVTWHAIKNTKRA